jgi:hypothetical protein
MLWPLQLVCLVDGQDVCFESIGVFSAENWMPLQVFRSIDSGSAKGFPKGVVEADKQVNDVLGCQRTSVLIATTIFPQIVGALSLQEKTNFFSTLLTQTPRNIIVIGTTILKQLSFLRSESIEIEAWLGLLILWS